VRVGEEAWRRLLAREPARGSRGGSGRRSDGRPSGGLPVRCEPLRSATRDGWGRGRRSWQNGAPRGQLRRRASRPEGPGGHRISPGLPGHRRSHPEGLAMVPPDAGRVRGGRGPRGGAGSGGPRRPAPSPAGPTHLP